MKKLIITFLTGVFLAPCLQAEGPPSNWPWRSWPSDAFSWLNENKWRVQVAKSQYNTDDWRRENIRIIGLTGGNKALEVVMKTENNTANDYTGGRINSKAGYWRIGWWEARTRVTWTRDNVWPTWWMWTPWRQGQGGDELDVMQFQRESLDQNHVKHVFGSSAEIVGRQYPGYNKKGRYWNAWHTGPTGTPAWEHDWAMAKVRKFSNWAVSVANNQNARFFIDGHQQHTGAKVWHGMNFIFSGTPHIRALPRLGEPIPNLHVDWLNAYHP